MLIKAGGFLPVDTFTTPPLGTIKQTVEICFSPQNTYSNWEQDMSVSRLIFLWNK